LGPTIALLLLVLLLLWRMLLPKRRLPRGRAPPSLLLRRLLLPGLHLPLLLLLGWPLLRVLMLRPGRRLHVRLHRRRGHHRRAGHRVLLLRLLLHEIGGQQLAGLSHVRGEEDGPRLPELHRPRRLLRLLQRRSRLGHGDDNTAGRGVEQARVGQLG
jgi:hypothetical protein